MFSAKLLAALQDLSTRPTTYGVTGEGVRDMLPGMGLVGDAS